MTPPITIDQKSRNEWNSGTAAMLSFVLPGSGQLYGGKTIPGLIWLWAVVCGYLASLPLGLAAHGICVLDATEHRNRREPLDDAPAVEISRRGAYAFSAMVFAIMIIAAATVLSR
jgi:hypothetical protein